MRQTYRLLAGILMTCILLLLHGCGNDATEEKAPRPIPQLSDLNIKQFVTVLQQDYEHSLEDIENAYDEHKANNDPDGYFKYRNLTWTPAYIDLKNHYSAVLYENKPYLARKRLLPLFSMFDNVLKIGLDLKKAMSDNDERYHGRAVDSIQKDRLAFTKLVVKLQAS
ncbi:hypothetical protein [Aliamphritea ceti]|uniref:hypothetical protein n=1 Tax=Aliamphritea ceti TaxID=1524258 RepID=UPI0021C4C167|nr:hypothetical protein [Aliamphritea ceti]